MAPKRRSKLALSYSGLSARMSGSQDRHRLSWEPDIRAVMDCVTTDTDSLLDEVQLVSVISDIPSMGCPLNVELKHGVRWRLTLLVPASKLGKGRIKWPKSF